jgi:chemotaxis regulatin CheY-phosphate phosphatase CheZ
MAFTAAQFEVHLALDQAERCVAATGKALLQGLPERVHAATRELHDSAHALALALRGVEGGAALAQAARERLIRVARDIAQQREALLRRSAAVERSLQTLVPQQNQSSTYSGALGRYAARAASGAVFRSV